MNPFHREYFARCIRIFELIIVGFSLPLTIVPVPAQNLAPPEVPVQVIVTLKPSKAGAASVLRSEDFNVAKGRPQLAVTGVAPLGYDGNALELLLVIDDAASPYLQEEIPEIGRFITDQRANTLVGLAWLHPAGAEMAVLPTVDHKRAIQALRAPHDVATRPYVLLSELIRSWPASAVAREIILFSSGADDPQAAGDGVSNQSLDRVITDAQRAGIIIHGMSVLISGPPKTVAALRGLGYIHLGKLTDETGGGFYSTGPPFKPHLVDLSRRLANQYRVTLTALPGAKTQFVTLKLSTAVSGAKIEAAPARVYVPAASTGAP